jgi:hypothetical protein
MVQSLRPAARLAITTASRRPTAQAVDVGQDLGDGVVQRRRDLAALGHELPQRAGQRRPADHRDAGGAGGLADAAGQLVGALGGHARRAAVLGAVAQGHRVVGRVDEDDVGRLASATTRRLRQLAHPPRAAGP